jgi:hypothetical protein
MSTPREAGPELGVVLRVIAMGDEEPAHAAVPSQRNSSSDGSGTSTIRPPPGSSTKYASAPVACGSWARAT